MQQGSFAEQLASAINQLPTYYEPEKYREGLYNIYYFACYTGEVLTYLRMRQEGQNLVRNNPNYSQVLPAGQLLQLSPWLVYRPVTPEIIAIVNEDITEQLVRGLLFQRSNKFRPACCFARAHVSSRVHASNHFAP